MDETLSADSLTPPTPPSLRPLAAKPAMASTQSLLVISNTLENVNCRCYIQLVQFLPSSLIDRYRV